MCIAGLGACDKGNGGAPPTAFVDDECSHEALKCVYNCIFLDDKVKPYFEQCGGIAASCRWLAQKNVSIEVQFLLCRILFFVAVHRADIIDQLIQHDIAASAERILNENVEKLVADPSVKDHGAINPSTVTTEVLKLLFGINLACPSGKQQENDESKEGGSYRELLKGCLVPIFKLTFRLPAPQPLPMAAPLSHAIHVLMQYPYRSMHEVWTEHYTQLVPRPMSLDESHTYLVDALIALLRDTIGYLIPTGNPDDATPADRAQHNIDACLSPLILVIQSIVQDDVVACAQFAHALLPQQE
ncbi:guanine nucleotide exchange factor [Gongronella butleri]|nr:guanine nucleotide exchange factor [Gongronella butleri]